MSPFARAAVAIFALTAIPAVACERHSATTARGGADAQEPATTASTRSELETKGCPHAARAAHKNAESPCPHAAARAAAAADAAPAATATFTGSGKVLCARCDLKQSETCRSVFKVSDGDKIYGLCGDGLTDQIRKMTEHGELEVTVHGRVLASEDGDDVLCIDGFSVGTI